MPHHRVPPHPLFAFLPLLQILTLFNLFLLSPLLFYSPPLILHTTVLPQQLVMFFCGSFRL
jgi:hypothetical protein